MSASSYTRALGYSVLLCIVESGLLLLATLIVFAQPRSLGEARLLAIFAGGVTIVRLLCNAPVTAIALLRAAPWLRRGGKGRIAFVNTAVYVAGFFSLAVTATVFGDVRFSEIPPIHFAVVGACLLSPYAVWFASPFGKTRPAIRHAA